MRRSFYVLLFSLIVATVVCAYLDVDMKMASLFYQPGAGFPIGKLQPWKFLYHYGEYPAYTMGIVALLIAIAGYFRPSLYAIRRQALFIAIVLIIGPGILVNTIFKGYWEDLGLHMLMCSAVNWIFINPGTRDRPRRMPHFPPAIHQQPSTSLFRISSCGEKKQRSKALLWLWGGILFGVIMGITRVIQGGHFVTDVIWSAGFVYLTAMVLAIVMFPRSPELKEPECQI